MKLFSVMGTSPYSETSYYWAQASEPGAPITCYAPVAICSLLPIDTLVLLCTAEAEEKHLDAVRQAVDQRVNLVPVRIPAGKNEDELWQFFNLLADNVQEQEEIALDITHGYRSLSFTALLSVEFLRTAKQAQTRYLLYGAWDARDTATPPRTPILDLTPMLRLLAWEDAADRFTRHGEAEELAQLLREEQPPYARQKASKESSQLAKTMGSAAGTLHELAESISVVRTTSVMRKAYKLSRILTGMDISGEPAASPFLQMMKQVRQFAESLAMADPQSSPQDNLRHQRELIRWYAEHGRYVQAATLGREWLLSWLMVRRGCTDLLDQSTRENAENDLNCAAQLQRNVKTASLEGVPADVDLVTWWHKIAHETRNDIDHAGMRKQETPADELIKRIRAFSGAISNWPI